MYNALQPRKRQRNFPERRQSVKAKPTIPNLSKDQSTLTQLEFVTPTSSRVETIDSSGDEELDKPRPKKKRRKSKFDEKEAGQSTMTQYDRGLFGRKAENFELDEDGFQIWQDSDPERPMNKVAEPEDKRGKMFPRLQDAIEDAERVETVPEIPETSQAAMYPPAPMLDKDRTDGAPVTTKFATPRKVRFQEVPSSQTPPSTMGSIYALPTNREPERSPLKERSANVPSAPPSGTLNLESQNISMKMLERVRFETRKIPLNDAVDQTLSNENAQSTNNQINAEDSPAVSRKLVRASTIQDSQSEEAGLSNVSSAETTVPLTRKLKRVSTVQDSQVDDDDFLTVADELDDANYNGLELVEDSQFAGQDTQQDYFDPANSALDRDALRFGLTQTQPRLPDINEVDTDDETDDDDLDRGCVIIRNDRVNIAFSSPPRQGNDEAPVVAQDAKAVALPPSVTKHSALLHFRRPDSRDDSAYDSGDHANDEEVPVLSSSPPLRPSQVSTVVPTQASVLEEDATREEVLRHSQPAAIVEPLTVPISPYKPTHYAEILSSSPYPLPPWSSPEKVHGMEDGDSSAPKSSQLAKLVDYSLPPPPALSSSGRQTPVSSST